MELGLLKAAGLGALGGIGIRLITNFMDTPKLIVNKYASKLYPQPESFGSDKELTKAFYLLQGYREHNSNAFVEALLTADQMCFFANGIEKNEIELDIDNDGSFIDGLFVKCHENLDALLKSTRKSEGMLYNSREEARVQYEKDLSEWKRTISQMKRQALEQGKYHDNEHDLQAPPKPQLPEMMKLNSDSVDDYIHSITNRLLHYVEYVKKMIRRTLHQIEIDRVYQKANHVIPQIQTQTEMNIENEMEDANANSNANSNANNSITY